MKLDVVGLQKHAEETPVGAIELSEEQLAAVVGGGHEHHERKRHERKRHERERHEHEHHKHHHR